MSKPLISIIVPVYNVQDYVLKCLASLKRQEYSNIEIVVVDDGSTDDSGSICDDFAKKEKNVQVFHKKNGGLSSARNYGLKKSKGEIVAFVDSDDYVKKEYISDMYEKMRQEQADIVVCGYNLEKPEIDKTLSGDEATVRLLTRQLNIDILAWNKLYKKDLFLKNNIWFPEGENHEDLLTTYKVYSKAKSVSYINKSLYQYVDRSDSITKKEKVVERLNKREKAAKEAVKYLEDDKDLVEAAWVSLLLAEYAFVDFAISGKIEERYGEKAKEWIKKNIDRFKNNKYMTKKLKLYNYLLTTRDGKLYIAFRKTKHE